MVRILVALLFLTGCSPKEDFVCQSDCARPLLTCQRECKGYINTTIRYGNTTNVYSCSCDNY